MFTALGTWFSLTDEKPVSTGLRAIKHVSSKLFDRTETCRYRLLNCKRKNSVQNSTPSGCSEGSVGSSIDPLGEHPQDTCWDLNTILVSGTQQ